jgi:aryl-alcohol dehydrogenase-like predicted oxidoreductase
MRPEISGLRQDYQISRIITGCWQLAGGHGAVDRAHVVDHLLALHDAGYTTFDCADIYTGVEEILGELRRTLHLKRGEQALKHLKVHTKFVPDLDALPHLNRASVRQAIERALRRLNCERLDLVQFHWWDYQIPGVIETALWLKELQEEGKIHLLGGTNFDVFHLRALRQAGVELATMQVQYSLLDQRPAGTFAATAAEIGTALLCYGTLAGGFISARWLGHDEPSEPLSNRSLTKYKLIIDEFGGWDLFQELLRCLDEIARRHGVSIPAVAARHVLDQPAVAAVIIGARSNAHLDSLSEIGKFRLDAADIDAIKTVLAKHEGPAGEVYALEREREGKHGAIMKYNLNAKI